MHQTVPVVDRQLHALRRKRGLHVAEQAQPDGFLLLLGHVAGIQLFYVTEHGHVIDLRLADEAPQRRDLAPVIEAGVAAEAEAVAIGLIHVTPQWADCRTKASAYAYSRMACTGRGWRARRRAARRMLQRPGKIKRKRIIAGFIALTAQKSLRILCLKGQKRCVHVKRIEPVADPAEVQHNGIRALCAPHGDLRGLATSAAFRKARPARSVRSAHR